MKPPSPTLRFVVPLFAYYAIALAVPIANGSGSTDAHFLEHAAFVVIGPLAMLATFFSVRLASRSVLDGNAWRSVSGRGTPTREPRKG